MTYDPIESIIKSKDSEFKRGYIQCMDDLVAELRDANSFAIIGMQPVMQRLRTKAYRLVGERE